MCPNRIATLCNVRNLAKHRAPSFPKTHASSLHTFTRSTSRTTIAESINGDGACIISGFYSPHQISSFSKDINPHLETLNPGRPKVPTSSIPQDNEQFLSGFHGARTKRLSNLFSKSPTFTNDFLEDSVLHNICDAVMRPDLRDEYWLSVAQLISLGPGAEAQMPHTDGAQWWPFFDLLDRRRANIMLLNFLVAMSDTTVENGATAIVPNSHLTGYTGADTGPSNSGDRLPQTWSPNRAISVPLKAGDCLLVGGGLVHFGGANRTSDTERRVLSIAVVNSAFTPEEANPMLVGAEVAAGMSERAKRFVGLGTEALMPVGSFGVWSRGV